MASLSKEERIRISGKIVNIPLENGSADSLIADLEVNKTKAEEKDSGHKKLADEKTELINGYQDELAKYDSIVRTELIEQDYVDSADRVLNNFFYPNDPNTPTPNLSDGVWPKFVPYAYNKAIGKTYLEVYAGSTTKEQDKIDVVLTKISAVEAFTDIQRSTGQHCVTTSTGTCSDPSYTDETSCVNAGETWTAGPDEENIETYPAMQTAGDELKTAIQDWEDFLNTIDPLIITFDTDTTRSAENTASKDDIANAISIIDTWQSLDDYDTNHGQTTCSGFNSYNVSLLDPTKFRAAELQAIKDELTARQSFISTRQTQLENYLGDITQDLSSGDITNKSGLYGERYGFIDLRLNVMGGSLNEVKGYERGQDAQQQLKNANDNATSTYDDVMKVSLLRAPAAGTKVVHVMDGSEFSAGDSIYIVGNDQDEISAIIESKDNNTLYLDTTISKKYTRAIQSRIYKVL